MATDNNINEFENGNENELNEYSEAANREELSKHMKEKSAKNREAQLRISRKQKNKKFIKSNTVRIYKTGQTADNAKYEIGETGSYSGNNRINTHTVKISDYNSHLIKKIETDSVTQQIRSELQDILRAADFEGKPVSAIVEGIYSHLSKITASDDSSDRANVNMHKMAAKFFKESYEAIDKANLTPKNRVIAAQSIADLMIKNYSPIAFIEKDDKLDQYTDKYVVRDTPLLKEQLENLNVQNVDKLINDINAALENGFEYDQYEINENVINSGNESINTHTLNMPSYNNYWIKHIEKDGVTQQVRAELNNILKAAGVKENDASALVDDIHGPLSQTVSFDHSIDRQNINMHEMAAKFFKDSYAAIDKANLGPKNRVIAAQKIADLMIKNYSPVAFVKGDELGQYTDKYVAQNKALLKDQLEMLNVQNVDTLIGGVEEALANGFQYDQSEPAAYPTTVQNMNNEQHVANPEEDSLKPRIPDFYQKLGERMDSADITRQVKDEIAYIIIEAGITDASRVAGLSEASYDFVKERINRIYDKETVPETKMSKDAPTFFRNAYESLNEFDLSTQDQIIIAQKIANVMLKNYSPVAFIEEGLEHYANDYVLNNRDVFKSQLDMLRLYNAEALMDDVDAARGAYAQIDNENTEFTRWLNGRIESTAVFDNVYDDLSNILQNAGFTKQEDLPELVKFIQYYTSRTIIDSPYLDGDNPNMHDIAIQFFEGSYRMIESAGLSSKDRIIAAQKIADVMLKNYSPVGIDSGEFGVYADNYVLGNKTLLSEQLKKLEVEDIDALIADRDIAKVVGPEKRIPDMINGARLREKPRDFMLDKFRNDKAITNIKNILAEAGIAEDAAQNLDVGDILEDAYSEKNIPTASISMRDVAKHVFVSTYAELTKKDLTPNNKIETAQKIADVILKNYSPIIRNRALKKYADNYVLKDSDLLKESLTALNVQVNEDGVGVDEEKNVENIELKENVDNPQETKTINDESRVAVYTEKLKAYNNMYKLDIDSNHFASSVTEAWELMTSGDKQKMADGQKVMNNLFKDTLKKAFDVEKDVAYNEHRLPEYAEIIKSTNELMRSAMYGFTDMYHNAKRTELFEATAFGGLNDKDMADLTVGQSLWSMDQKSDEAWDIQSKEAKDIAEKWMKEDKPHEKMIAEMKALVESNEKGIVSRKEMVDKLTAAEWLLENDEKMMIDDPYDPYNKVPNWGNRYWKTLTETREALGIDKHTSMRDMIQADYAASAKAANNRNYNLTQINYYVLDKDVRELADSRDVQMEQFAIQGAAVKLTKPQENKELEDNMTETRKRHPVEQLNERNIMKNEPKNDKWIVEEVAHQELTILNQANSK